MLLHVVAALMAAWIQGAASIRGRLVSVEGRPLVRAQVRLERDQSLRGIEVTLTRRAGKVTGAVSDARGPVAGSNVVVYASDRALWYAQSRFLGRATTRSDGAFSIDGLPPGDYFAAAFDRGRATEAGGEWQDPELLESVVSQATRVTLDEGQQVALTLKLITR
jgi:hypothetical protein